MERTPAERLMDEFAEAWVAGDADRVAACLTTDFTWQLASGIDDVRGQVVHGREAARALLRARFTAPNPLSFTDVTYRYVDDLVLQSYRVSGQLDGTRVDAIGLDIYRIREGRIASKDAYWKQVRWTSAATSRVPSRQARRGD